MIKRCHCQTNATVEHLYFIFLICSHLILLHSLWRFKDIIEKFLDIYKIKI